MKAFWTTIHIKLLSDKFEKRMSFSIEDNQLQSTLSLILEWLREDKIISYDIKLKSLSDDYEEYIDE